MAITAPGVASAHLVPAGGSGFLLAVDTGRLHAVDEALYDAVEQSMRVGDEPRVRWLMAAAGLLDPRTGNGPPPVSVPVRAISLAIAAKCNLGCTYCYAEQGTFGGTDRQMSIDIAKEAIDRLIGDANAGETVRLIFLGGEPLVNREGLREATLHAVARAASADVKPAFSLTTNATLLTQDDADFLDRNAFAVTISIDGIGAAHDRLRPFRGGRGSYDRVAERARMLLSRPRRRCVVAARVSVTPANLDLRATLTDLLELGFDSVQFAPVLSAPSGRAEMGARELEAMLSEMIACGRLFERRLEDGIVLPFANVIGTLTRIHHGARDEYPCAAGGSYVGVSAEGKLYACHRFVGDEATSMGDIRSGLDPELQSAWLKARNVRFQEPCRSCWARHLCGGGCHYEVMNRGRTACDYIRGWLDYCLGAYIHLLTSHPRQLREIVEPGPGPTQ